MAYWRLFYHLVWGTKRREPLITPEVEAIISRSFDLTGDDVELLTHARGFMPDHVHLALSIPPKLAITEAVRRLKGASSHAVNQLLPQQTFGWQGSYGVLSFGERHLGSVNAYVRNQVERHARSTLNRALEQTETAGPRVESASTDFRR